MLRTNIFRAALVLPAALAIALVGLAGQASASPADNTAIYNEILNEFKPQEIAPAAPPAVFTVPAFTTVTAKADELVYAIFRLSANPAYNTADPADLAELVASALEPATANGAVRADRNTIVARLIDAALQGSGHQEDPLYVNAVVNRVATVNASQPVAKQLTSAGKALAIAQGLKSATQDNGTASGLANIAFTIGTAGAPAASVNTQFQSFVIAALKSVTGTSVQNVSTFIDASLDKLGVPATDSVTRNNFAVNVAKGVITLPVTAGYVLGGRAQEIAGATPDSTTDANVVAFLDSVAANTALVKAIPDAVARGFFNLSAGANRTTQAASLATNKTIAAKGNIASGALRFPGASSTADILNAVRNAAGTTANTINTNAEFSAFAGQAAVGNSGKGADIITNTNAQLVFAANATVLSKQTAIQLTAINVIKSIAPDASDTHIVNAAARVVTDNPSVYATTLSKSTLAGALAKGITTDNNAAGAAVAGVYSVSQTPAQTPAQNASEAASFAVAGIKGNSKAVVSIAQQVAALASSANFNTTDFAKSVANTTGVTSAQPGSVAAGVSVADPTNSGAVTKAIVQNTTSANSKAAVTIATTVATSVDIENVADVAAALGTLVNVKYVPASGPAPTTPILTIANLATIATNLTKAINTKVLPIPAATNTASVDFNGGWRNRVDEIGELAAVLTKAAIVATQALLSQPTPAVFAAQLALIGTNIYKAVSATLILNGGNLSADVLDVAKDVAGAIFQTIKTSTLNATNLALYNDLLSAGGSLNAKLQAGITAKGIKALVEEARAAVQAGNGGVFETGSTNDPETPSKNV